MILDIARNNRLRVFQKIEIKCYKSTLKLNCRLGNLRCLRFKGELEWGMRGALEVLVRCLSGGWA